MLERLLQIDQLVLAFVSQLLYSCCGIEGVFELGFQSLEFLAKVEQYKYIQIKYGFPFSFYWICNLFSALLNVFDCNHDMSGKVSSHIR